MNYKKFLSLGLCILSLGAVFTGCGDSEESNSNAAKADVYTESGYPIIKEGEEVSISFFTGLRPSVTTYDSSTNPATKHFEDLTGIKMEFIETTDADKKQKFNVMMTGGDYTDVVLDMWNSHSELALYGQQGLFIPLEDLIREHAPNIQAALDAHPVVKDTWTLEDGHMYTIPRIGSSTHSEVSQRMWLNKQWLDNLGLEVPKTTEDFYKVLKAFKEQDANGNGDPNDEIPLSGAVSSGWNTNPIPYLANAFIPCTNTSNYLNIDENGKVYFAKVTDEWKEFLKYMNRLHEEGLIDPLLFSQTKDQLLKLGSNPGDVIMGATTGGSVSVFTNTTNYDVWNQYIALPPLTGPEGVCSAVRSPDYGSPVLSITNKCEYPEAVVRLFDYLYTEEGLIWSQFGEIGNAAIDIAPEGSLNIIGEPAKYVRLPFDNIKDLSWNRMGPDYRPADYDLWFTAKENPAQDIEKILYESAVNDYLPVAQDPATIMPKVAFTTEESRVIVDTTTNMNMYIDQVTAEFVTGTRDIDAGWDEYINTLNSQGLQSYIDVNQAAYDRNY
ncbi:hypothetical protein AN641_06770 [Candidatus Epulonipiscioides gigas]|nr:hypothetical protein AN641_06770 [Epulopiscium sp. SCG-C07WGA-EpuloA2]